MLAMFRGNSCRLNHPRYILHYTSKNLIDWNFESKLNLSSEKKLLTLVYLDYRTVFSECGTRTSGTDLIHILPTARTYIIGKLKAVPPMMFRTRALMYLNSGGKYWLITDCWSGFGRLLFGRPYGLDKAKQSYS